MRVCRRLFLRPEDTVGDLKKLIAAQIGVRAEKIVLKKWYTIYKDHITLADCTSIQCHSLYLDEIKDGMSLEMHFQ